MPSPTDSRKNFVPLRGQAAPVAFVSKPVVDNRVLWVLLAGLATTAIALAAQYFLSARADVHIMGWYLDYVIPAGAILVGLAASSGYAVMSLWLGVRIRKGLLITIVLLMLSAYFGAEYIEFRSQGPMVVVDDPNALVEHPAQPGAEVKIHQLGFWEYFNLKAVTWTWKKEHDSDKENSALGMWGYAFVLLGIAGFTLSGLILPTIVGARAYCEPCQRYMKRRPLTLLPASMPYKKFSKKEAAAKAEYDEQHKSALDQGSGKTQAMIDAANRGDAVVFSQLLADPVPPRKQVEKLPRRLDVSLCRCPICASGFLEIKIKTGQGKQLKVVSLSKEKLAPEFVRAVQQ